MLGRKADRMLQRGVPWKWTTQKSVISIHGVRSSLWQELNWYYFDKTSSCWLFLPAILCIFLVSRDGLNFWLQARKLQNQIIPFLPQTHMLNPVEHSSTLLNHNRGLCSPAEEPQDPEPGLLLHGVYAVPALS